MLGMIQNYETLDNECDSTDYVCMTEELLRAAWDKQFRMILTQSAEAVSIQALLICHAWRNRRFVSACVYPRGTQTGN